MGSHPDEVSPMERHLQSKVHIGEQAGRDILDIEPQGFGKLGVLVSNMTVGVFTGSGTRKSLLKRRRVAARDYDVDQMEWTGISEKVYE